MPLESPRLDDRDFDSLLAEARRRAADACPGWTDHSPSDPGMVLLELFAFLTDVMIYRLNRVPEKAYVEFLGLLGVERIPPSAASTTLRFRRSGAGAGPIEIPRGTRVTTGGGGGEGPVFVTARPVTIEPGAETAEVTAYHCELVEAEPLGTGTGRPGLSLSIRRPPVVAPTGDELDLVVGVEVAEGELDDRVPALRHAGATYRIWREVEDFTDLGADRHVYVVDRVAGTVSFAPALRERDEEGALPERPAALAEAPPAGRDIRAWYRRGGGPDGNVAAESLTTLKDPIVGVEVVNPEPAAGGRAGESLENALLRGPQELHSLERAVTARDFELLAGRGSGAVARAKAVTLAELWAHAEPGTVEVLLVPHVPEAARSGPRVTVAQLAEREAGSVVDRVAAALEPRKGLGTRVHVAWARYKEVAVHARVVVYSQEDPDAVEERVLRRLHRNLNPLPAGSPDRPEDRYEGWAFGRTLRESDVFDVVLAEPGVSYVDRVRLRVDDVPDGDVPILEADPFQPRTWYAGCRDTLFRSLNHGEGWEPAGRFEGRGIHRVAVHPDVPGVLAVVTLPEEGSAAWVHVSRDCGETWTLAGQLAFEVEDLTWVVQGGVPVVLLATDKGLYALSTAEGASPVQTTVDPKDADLGFYAVTATTHADGSVNVAVAAQRTRGVYLSVEAGADDTFRHIGLREQDVRALATQSDGPRRFLWAGIAAAGDEPGRGCFSWELRGSEDPPEGWVSHDEGWEGGSCHDLAFLGSTVVAASHKQGVMRLASRDAGARWEPSDVRSNLPLRDPGRFHPVRAVATDLDDGTLMTGTPEGVYRRDGEAYVSVSRREFERVTLPPTWLFCSGDHAIEVVTEDATRSD